MTCLSLLVSVIMAGVGSPPAQVAKPVVSAPMFAVAGSERLSDPRLAEIRGGRVPGRSDRLSTEVAVREMTALQGTAGQQMDAWWASTGATMIAANLVR